jgi:U3 small nucleolar RNA-associated protein 18
VVDYIEEEEESKIDANGKGKGKAVWQDPSDELLSVDMEGDRRLKKLARGKGKKGVVNGQELQLKLKEQYVFSF